MPFLKTSLPELKNIEILVLLVLTRLILTFIRSVPIKKGASKSTPLRGRGGIEKHHILQYKKLQKLIYFHYWFSYMVFFIISLVRTNVFSKEFCSNIYAVQSCVQSSKLKMKRRSEYDFHVIFNWSVQKELISSLNWVRHIFPKKFFF